MAQQHSSTEEEDRNRLLELKLIPENLRTHKQQVEINKLNEQHKTYANLNASEMEKTLHKRPNLVALAVQSPGTSALLALDYQNTFANKPGFTKPSLKNGMQTLTFNSEQDAADFLMSQAGKSRRFRVMDGQQRLIATSNGKGTLQYAAARKPLQNTNTQPVQQGPRLRPLMTRPRSAKPAKPLVNAPIKPVPVKHATPHPTPLSTKPSIKPVPPKPIEIKPTAPRPTPFKRTPFDQ